ncbi:copper amine oxidase N-terminal domain-containing protein [Zhurongbacter thermophilus]
MKRWFIVVIIGFVIGAIFLTPIADAVYEQIVNIFVDTIYTSKLVVDVIKDGNTFYILSSDGNLQQIENNRLVKSMHVSSNYQLYRILSVNDKYLWLISVLKGYNKWYLRASIIDKETFQTISYTSFALNSTKTIDRIDVVPVGRLVSVSPPKVVVDKVNVAVMWQDKSINAVSIQFTVNLSTGIVRETRHYFSYLKAIDSEGAIATKIYALGIDSSSNWKLYSGNASTYTFSQQIYTSNLPGIYAGDLEVKGNKAYVVLARVPYVYMYLVDLVRKQQTFLGFFRIDGVPRIVGMTFIGDRAIAVVKGDNRTYVFSIKDAKVRRWYSISHTFTIGDYSSPENGYIVPGGFFLPTNRTGYSGMIFRFYDSLPSITLKAYKDSAYQKNPSGCDITFSSDIFLGINDTLYGDLIVYSKERGIELYHRILKNKGYKTLAITLPKKGENHFKTYFYVRMNGYTSGGRTEWRKIDIQQVCFDYIQPKAPVLSSISYDGKSRYIKVKVSSQNKYVKRTLSIFVKKEGEQPRQFTTYRLSKNDVRYFNVELPTPGKYLIYVKEYMQSGLSPTVALSSNTLQIQRTKEVPLPIVTMDSRTYKRTFSFNVKVAVTGTLEVQEGNMVYKMRARVGDNTVTINMKGRGRHTIKVRLCSEGICTAWQTYNIELYDYIEMWIGKRAYKLNGEDKAMDAAPFIDPVASRTVVPLRFILEGLSFQVKWDGSARTITVKGSVSRGNRTVIINMPKVKPSKRGRYTVYMGNPKVEVKDRKGTYVVDMRNYKGQDMGIPFIYENRTYVPVRFISEIFEGKVGWDGAERKVTIER